MNRWMKVGLLVVGVVGFSGCTGKGVEHFTLEVDLPPQFELKTAANYRPATGETCVLPRRRGKRPERKVFFTDYKPAASRVSYELPLTETVEGCPLVLRSLEFDFYAKWGKRSTDVGGDIANISIRDYLDMPGMRESDAQDFSGQCQWLFRTVGPLHGIRKILQCRSVNAEGKLQKTRVGGYAQRDELPGKTLRMVLTLSNEERPAFDDNWVAVPGGWKRCKGKDFSDRDAYCNGNTTDFKPIKMPDGRICDIYPSCE